MEPYLNGFTAQLLLQPTSDGDARIQDLLQCYACFKLEPDERLTAALSFKIVQKKVKNGEIDVELWHLFRKAVSAAEPNDSHYLSYIHVGLLTHIFVDTLSEDAWRYLDVVFGEETCIPAWRHHIEVRKRKLTLLLGRWHHLPLPARQQQLLATFPKETTLHDLRIFVQRHPPTIQRAVNDVHREALDALKSHRLSATAWSLIGAPCFEKRALEGVVWSANEILDHTIYQRDDLKLPQEIPHHLRTTTQHTIQHALQHFIQSVQNDTPLRPNIHSSNFPDNTSPGAIRRAEVDVIEPDLKSDDGDDDVTDHVPGRTKTTSNRHLVVSPADLVQLREIQYRCEAVMGGARIPQESLTEPSPFVRSVLHKHTHH